MIRVGIIGGAGYTAGELLRILTNHPNADIVGISSTSNDGKLISSVHGDLIGETDIVFSEFELSTVDVLFLCSGHGKSVEFLNNNKVPEKVKIIDLSADFRLKTEGNKFIYGLCELNRELIKKANYIANPGCFATSIELALLPLATASELKSDIQVTAITGSTGAGQRPTATTHFSWRNSNLSSYKAFEHQHLAEIGECVKHLQNNFDKDINFVPIRGCHTRGILASVYMDFDEDECYATKLFEEYYASHPFTHIASQNPDLKQVVNTNKGVLHLKKHGDKLHIISIIDNLIKGASGQAVQNMNLMFNINEDVGLRLKPVGF
ncbi:MAG: N-acetyl-gamma-glutamyl-phosphate reductase [Bacteroidales bacterium]